MTMPRALLWVLGSAAVSLSLGAVFLVDPAGNRGSTTPARRSRSGPCEEARATSAESGLHPSAGARFTACGGGGEDIGVEKGAHPTLPLRGVSLAGAEFGVDPYGKGPLPGTFGVNYMYPDSRYVPGYASPTYFMGKGMTVFRLPFRWERLQPARNAPFDAAELARLTTTVANLTTMGAAVILDPHNYARYGSSLIGSAAVPNSDFADLWSRLAAAFKGNPKVLFGLMNEPHDMPTEQWVTSANAAIVAIRSAGAANTILVPGNGWSGAQGWSATWYGTSNATALLAIQDPGHNHAFEAHQYLDPDGGGSSQTCVSATIGSQRMAGFTRWLRANGKRGFLGEFGASSSPTCIAAVDDLLSHIEANADVYLGWSYWAGGPWWGKHWMAIEPVGGGDAPQMTALLRHLTAAPVVPAVARGTLRIMPLGDSITLGVNGGYRNGLWTRLTRAGRTIDFVGSQIDPYTVAPNKGHEGHPGFTIGNIAARADAWLTAATPSHVLLMIGTNDVAWWCAQTASQVADLNAGLIDKILVDRPGAWVIVGSIPPLTPGIIQPNNVDRAQLARDYNVELKKRIMDRIARGKQVRFADVNAVLTVGDLYDGVHPTQLAADKVAQVWYDALIPILP